MQIKRMLKTLFITGVSAFAGLLCSPFASAVIVLFWLHSWVASWRLQRFGFIKMQGMDAYMAQYPDMMVNMPFFLGGTPTIDMMRQSWQKVLKAQYANGQLKFEKFSQVMEKYYGLWYWRNATKLNLNHHIQLYSGDCPSSESELKTVIGQLSSMQIQSDLPQWQTILIPLKGDFLDTKIQSCALMRFHHAIADGYTFFRMLTSHFQDQQMPYAPANMLGNTKAPSKFRQLFMFAYAMSSLFRIWLVGRITERNLLHGQQLNGKEVVTWATLDMKVVKSLKNATNATVSDVLLSSLTGAIKKYMIFKDSTYPGSISCVIPMGQYKPGQTDYKLDNNLLILRLCLPMKLQDQLERLKATKRAFDDLKHSPDLLAVKLGVKFLVPYFPKHLVDWLITCTNAVTIGTSSLVGPSENFSLFGSKVVMFAGFQPHNGLLGINIAFIGYTDKICIGFNADTAIIKSQEDMDLIIAFLVEELEDLHKKTIPGPVPKMHISMNEISSNYYQLANDHK